MPFIQPPVPPLPQGIDLSGKTAIVTGATAGIGLELSRQLLTHKVSNLVMAVRNVSKGESVRQALLSEPAIKAANPNANVKVMQLDTENYPSVQAFAAAYGAEFRDLHLLMANAGIGNLAREFASSGHEKHVQVNYLSNVLLTLALLPILEDTATRTGEPTRVTWTGSRMHKQSSIVGKTPLKKGEQVLKHFDTSEDIPAYARYGDSKLLCVLFQLELAKHYKPDKVIVNNFCPGMIRTSLTEVLPFYIRIPVHLMQAIRARSPEKAGWMALNAAVVVDAESHGRLLEDMVVGEVFQWIHSEDGEKVQKMVWNETIDEMAGMVNLPSWMGKLA
ncbi:hypothetical protein B0T10DRAFT_587483 [Thelonectria olida]|uniref:Uncharacterized protein n=1 Tax=Thelonectria olida TaxID=1576542 RepID=A0A9P8WB31_9HYPO|nr:hypothetical protein B0T10DRAFT_587483 [Thelonectria olida]